MPRVLSLSLSLRGCIRWHLVACDFLDGHRSRCDAHQASMFINPTAVDIVWPIQEAEEIWICGLQQLELGLELCELSHLLRSESAHSPLELLCDQISVNIDCSTT